MTNHEKNELRTSDWETTEIENLNPSRKQRFALFCLGYSLPIVIGFTIIDLMEGDTIEVLIDIFTGMILLYSFYALRKSKIPPLIYRLVLTVLSTAFLCNIILGAGNGTAIYWLYPLPPLFMFFLGKKEGGLVSAIFYGALCMVLLNPFSFDIYAYSIGASLRFLAALLLVSLISYGLESSRNTSELLLIEKQKKLIKEKEHLQKALSEIKTLSGLIPICSYCKKIRDDKGYWQRVEVYMKNHTDAQFTHGLCPDCIQTLYPDLIDSARE